ncbi:MAG: hypothetical protein HY094_00550 [Candidatus Melainabacteria bacterium]|nr:hypothetical protein [Candidatus Melainabacteria bacterium]
MPIALEKNILPGSFTGVYTGSVSGSKYSLVKKNNSLVPTAEHLEEIAFSSLVNRFDNNDDDESFTVTQRPKTDLPLTSDFGNVNPIWLLFARSGLKRLQYK